MNINRVAFPFPLSDSTVVQLYMPPTMSISDARRLKRMIHALYISGKAERKGGRSESN